MSIRSTGDPFKNGRFYHLPIFYRSLESCDEWDALSGGLRHKPITRDEFARALKKALRGEYSCVIVPANSVLHDDFEYFLDEADKLGIQIIYQVPASWLNRIWAIKEDTFKARALCFEIILDDVPGDTGFLEFVQKNYPTHFTLPGLRAAPVWQKLKAIPFSFFEDLHFYFPYDGDKKIIFKPSQVMERLEELRKLNPEAVFRSPLGIDIYEPRIEPDQDLEPLVEPIVRRLADGTPQISVVIPAFNNGKYLVNTLRHLEAQDLGKDQYEVIVVDDGSADATSELILEAARTTSMPLTVLYYPRMKPRQMGDSQFRAGLARNLGVKWASGEILVFVDSDIIVPQNFLSETLRLHASADVVQWRRDYLNKNADSINMEYKKVDEVKDCFVPEDGYWHGFYEAAAKQGWMQLPDYWKYVCTYGLSLRRKTFKDLGWFRKTYCFYGFEDTDLGLRLAQKGFTFHFQNTPVYHLFHETDRSEFQNSTVLRQKLLKKTAKIFFHNNLSPDIYRIFKYLLKDLF